MFFTLVSVFRKFSFNLHAHPLSWTWARWNLKTYHTNNLGMEVLVEQSDTYISISFFKLQQIHVFLLTVIFDKKNKACITSNFNHGLSPLQLGLQLLKKMLPILPSSSIIKPSYKCGSESIWTWFWTMHCKSRGWEI